MDSLLFLSAAAGVGATPLAESGSYTLHITHYALGITHYVPIPPLILCRLPLLRLLSLFGDTLEVFLDAASEIRRDIVALDLL